MRPRLSSPMILKTHNLRVVRKALQLPVERPQCHYNYQIISLYTGRYVKNMFV